MTEENNIASALDKAIESDIAVSSEVSSDGTADKQILIRIPEKDRERWKQASETKGVPMSQFIRDVVNKEVEGVLDCRHPVNRRRYYPWAEFCLECGTRLRG
jgi:predicted DNA-binding protein